MFEMLPLQDSDLETDRKSDLRIFFCNKVKTNSKTWRKYGTIRTLSRSGRVSVMDGHVKRKL